MRDVSWLPRVLQPQPVRQRVEPGQALVLVRADVRGVRRSGAHQREVEDQVQFIVAVAQVGDVVVFADQHAVAGIFIQDGAQFLHQVVQAGPPDWSGTSRASTLSSAFLLGFARSEEAAQFGQGHAGRCAGSGPGLRKMVPMASRRKPSTPTIEPEADRIPHGLLDFRVAPVQVGLLLHEVVIVVLAAVRRA